ncbi:MAG: porin [Phyllobacteriaceae bacterium]|nr:porin [Phyllobacteriaceae bacterium]
MRARVNFDARSETEWGTLRSYIRLQASWNGVGDGPVAADQAWLSIGGLQMGYTESVWAASMNGGASNWGSHSWSGMSYGYQQRALIAYHFTGGNGLFGSISLEDDNNNNWAPDVVAKVGMTQGWGAVWAKAAYDESAAGWAGSLGAQVNVPNMAGSNFRLIGFYSSNANAYAVVDGFNQAFRWSVLASYNHQFNEKLGASLGFQYYGDANYAAAGSPNGWDVELSVVYMPVTNLEIRAELGYGSRDAGAFGAVPGAAFSGLNKGYLRVTRYF